ncbi:MAG TPA: PspC domain-containing protein [Jiangellaceae bacterium]|nr:PspC domain-containing protein [Jiangellaceae bacterium]
METTPTPPDGSDGAEHGTASVQRIRYRRSRDNRIVAGVLGGVGPRIGVDPVVLRVVIVVLTLFGAVGAILYAAGWLLLPAEDEENSIGEAALRGGPERTPGKVVLAAVLAFWVVTAGFGVIRGPFAGLVLTVLGVAAVVFLVRRTSDTPTTPATPTPPTTVTGSGWGDAGEPERTYPASAPEYPASEPQHSPDYVGWPEGPDWNERPTDPYATEPAVVAEQAVRPRRSRWLGPVTVCTALMAAGIAAIVAGTSTTADLLVAAALLVVGIGLLVGTWLGRPRGLIALGVLLTIALVATSVGSFLGWRSGELMVSPTTLAELEAQSTTDFESGRVTYDLRDLQLTDGDTATVSVEQGAGQVRVMLPEDIDVEIDASVGIGAVEAFDTSIGGPDLEPETITDDGSDGPGGGTVRFNIDLGLGQVEVTR